MRGELRFPTFSRITTASDVGFPLRWKLRPTIRLMADL
jgi:hypothetical protein